MKKKERKINSTCCERGSRDPVRFYGLKAPSVSAFETRYIYIYFEFIQQCHHSSFINRFCIQSLSMELAVRYIWVCAFFGSFFSPFLVYNTKLIRLRNFLCVVISKVEKARLIRCKVIQEKCEKWLRLIYLFREETELSRFKS